MLHIDDLLGSPNYKGIDYLVKRAKEDLQSLQKGGINGILIENWKEDSIGEFVSTETAACFTQVVAQIIDDVTVPFGFNILNNDYKLALSLAKIHNANFVELDVYADHVISDFKYSPISSKNPFEIKLNTNEVKNYADKIGASNIPLFVFVQPKHYKMIDTQKSIEKSVEEAFSANASAVLVTKETGTAPTIDLIKKAKLSANDKLVGIGSGLNIDNCEVYLSEADFGLVGTAIKFDNDTDNQVDPNKVRELMNKVNLLFN